MTVPALTQWLETPIATTSGGQAETLAQLPARFGVHPIAAPLGTRQSVLGVMAFIDGFQNERTLRGYPIIKCGHDVML